MDRSGRLPPARRRCSPTTGKFTRFPDAPPFVPGGHSHAGLSGVRRGRSTGSSASASCRSRSRRRSCSRSICLLVFAIGTARSTSERDGVAAALVTALFPPLPYFGALVLTEVWTTLLFTVAMWLACRAVDERAHRAIRLARRRCSALTTLSRPAFVLFPFALAAVGLVVLPLVRVDPRPRVAGTGRRCSPLSRSRCCRGSPTTTSTSAASRCRPPAASAAACGKDRGRDVVGTSPERADATSPTTSTTAPSSTARRASRRARAAAGRPDARVRASVARHPAHLGRADRSDRARAAARRRRPEYLRVALENIRARSDSAISRRGSRAACSSCGPAKFRFATATSTRLPPLVIRAMLGHAGGDLLAGARRARRARAAPAARRSRACSRRRSST